MSYALSMCLMCYFFTLDVVYCMHILVVLYFMIILDIYVADLHYMFYVYDCVRYFLLYDYVKCLIDLMSYDTFYCVLHNVLHNKILC